MINKKELPENFSGVMKFTRTTTDYRTGTDDVVIYIYHYRNSELHREDGPAVLLEGKPHQWWVHGRQLSEEEYGQFLEKKALKEKLESNLGEKGSTSREKI
ncbi:hypothetical protein [Acidovorax sp. SUPP3334]|uniref:hypothetical protein n=1 Tax=Acidovorax sp. SUPP3334 TaxID=2920881 RepID=UPI0023DE575B|nr:hypothetical protein [Acidovorax sp. SUPP3334]GKT21923.1 hypothetical protein AVHM3334_06530 [Acidovorax sp. SUPP3334]